MQRPSADGDEVKTVYRVKENVKLVKAYWLDLDVGVTEPNRPPKYPDQRAALVALDAFLRTSLLPRPMIVSSGYGIHVYWLLTEALLPGQWHATALQLKALAAGLKLLTDPVRTSDEASVLRPVGTTNRKVKDGKAAAMPVRCLLPTVPVSNNEFHGAIVAALKTADIEPVETDNSGKMKINPEDMIVPVGGYQKSSAHKVAERCQQIRLFKETGGVTEPHWYASLQLVRKSTEGEALAHEWSAKHAEYNKENTDLKLAQIRDMGPTLCKTFADKNPEGCKNCPFAGKISTPLQLGIVIEDAPAPKITEIIMGKEHVVEIPPPPWPYKRGNADTPGIFIELGQDAQTAPVQIYPYDLYPTKLTDDESKREGSVAIRHWLPNEGWRQFPMRLKMLSSPRDFAGEMNNNFVFPDNAKYMQGYTMSYLKVLQSQAKIQRLHSRLGWLDDGGFVLGERVFVPGGVHPAGVAGKGASIAKLYGSQGNLDTWQAVIDRLDRPGMEAHFFAVLLGYAAPLLKFTGFGGMVVAMQGPTGAGKSFSAAAMHSIYGGQFRSYMSTNEDTFNQRMEKLGYLCHLPFYMDETTNIKPEEAAKMMYMVSGGKGKGRLDRNADMRDAVEWQTIALMSANSFMVDKLREAKGDVEAESVRLFEYTVPKYPDFEREMPVLYGRLESNHGVSGEQYISALLNYDPTTFKPRVDTIIEQFHTQIGFQGKERFWYALVGCTLAGLLIAHSSGALKLADFHATWSRMWKWLQREVLRQRGDVAEAKVTPIEAVSQFLQTHMADTLVVQEAGSGVVAIIRPPAAHGKLLVQYNITTGQLYIDQTVWRSFCSKNQYNASELKTELVGDKVMKFHPRDFKVTLGRGTTFKTGQTRVWELDGKHPAFDGAIEKIIGGGDNGIHSGAGIQPDVDAGGVGAEAEGATST